MSENDDQNTSTPGGGSGDTPKPAGPELYHQELRHANVSARVPERIGMGVFCTGAVVIQGAHEFVVDFLQNMVPPHRIATRVVLPPTVVPLFLAALQENLQKYQQNFGPIPRLPVPPQASHPPIDEIYDQLKLPDEMLGGIYANTVMIVHSPVGFCFDFITNFYPRSVVTSRVYLSPPYVPQLFESMSHAFDQFRRKLPPNHPFAHPGPAPGPGAGPGPGS